MKYYLYALAMFLVIAWAIGYYGTNVGNSIHILLVIVAVALYLTTQNGKSFKEIFNYLSSKIQ